MSDTFSDSVKFSLFWFRTPNDIVLATITRYVLAIYIELVLDSYAKGVIIYE